ncbi:MAG: hypothetical protein DBY32_04015 [Phascolarctobacterium sp.]|nr:MAG: hypothetical protein DBY32_04015 [Phascolarctobacterium sp.]
MTDKLFNHLWLNALEQPNLDLYIGEYGYPDWFDEISRDAGEVVNTLTKIHRVAHMDIREIIGLVGTQPQFAEKFCIPVRTVEGWCSGGRTCADYLRLLFARQLGLI